MTMPERKVIRLPEYDYRSPGYYFITVCTREKAPLLCSIVGFRYWAVCGNLQTLHKPDLRKGSVAAAVL